MPTIAQEVTLWTDAGRAPLAAALLAAMGGEVRAIGVGGPRVSEVDDLAKALDAPREDDLRKLLVERPAAFVLLASLADVGEEERRTLLEQDTTVLTLEPLAASLAELGGLTHAGPRGEARVLLVPAFSHGPGFLRAADPQEVLGGGRLVALESCGRADGGSLFARLYDAWQTVLGFVPLPETIDASLAGPFDEPPDDLRRISGRLAAHARMAGADAAVLQLSDAASGHRRYLHVITPQAELRVTDAGYDLRHADGSVVDHGEVQPEGATFVDLIATQWRRLLDRPNLPPTTPPQREAEALACCLACLLSARTGQPESPRKLIALSS